MWDADRRQHRCRRSGPRRWRRRRGRRCAHWSARSRPAAGRAAPSGSPSCPCAPSSRRGLSVLEARNVVLQSARAFAAADALPASDPDIRLAVQPARPADHAGDARAGACDLLLPDPVRQNARRVEDPTARGQCEDGAVLTGARDGTAFERNVALYGVDGDGQQRDPVLGNERLELVAEERPPTLRWRRVDLAVLDGALVAGERFAGAALQPVLDRPGHVRHLVAQEPHVLDGVTLDQGRRR